MTVSVEAALLLSVAGVVCTAGVAWGLLKGRVQARESADDDAKKETRVAVREIHADVKDIKASLNSVVTRVAVLEVRVDGVMRPRAITNGNNGNNEE